MLHVVLDSVILHRYIFSQSLLRPIIALRLFWCTLRNTKILIEFSSVDIAIIHMEDFPKEFNISTDLEIVNRKIDATSISSEHFLTLQERSLRNSRVHLSWFRYLNGIIIQIEINHDFSHTIRFQPTLYTTLLEICVKP